MRQVFDKLFVGRSTIDSFFAGASRAAGDPMFRFRLVQCVLGSLLLAAAALKTVQLFSGTTADIFAMAPAWFAPAAVIGEFMLGTWLLSGLLASAAWVAGLVVFSGFAIYSASAIYQGRTSCGCFGAAKLNPRFALAIDLLALGLLLTNRPQPVANLRLRAGALIGGIVVLAAGTVLLVDQINQSANPGKAITIFQSEDWIGMRFPLLDQIDIADEISAGEWVVLLYHHDCPKCTQSAAKLVATINSLNADAPLAKRVAFVELPPFGPFESVNVPPQIRIGHMKLNDSSDIQTPTAIRIMTGVVKNLVPL